MKHARTVRQLSPGEKAMALVLALAMILGLGPWYGVAHALVAQGGLTVQDNPATVTVNATPVTTLEDGKSYVFMAQSGESWYAMKAAAASAGESLAATAVAVSSSGENMVVTFESDADLHKWSAEEDSYDNSMCLKCGSSIVFSESGKLLLDDSPYYPYDFVFNNDKGGFVNSYGDNVVALSSDQLSFVHSKETGTIPAQAYEVVAGSSTDPVTETATVTIKAKNSSGEVLEVGEEIAATIKDGNDLVYEKDYGTNTYELTVGKTYSYRAIDNTGNTYTETTGAFEVTSGMTEFTITMEDALSGYALSATVLPDAAKGAVKFFGAKYGNDNYGQEITRAEQGDTVGVKTIPAEGYELESITGTCGGWSITLTDSEEIFCDKTFPMWGGDTNVTVTFREKTSEPVGSTYAVSLSMTDPASASSTWNVVAGRDSVSAVGQSVSYTKDSETPAEDNDGAMSYKLVYRDKEAAADAEWTTLATHVAERNSYNSNKFKAPQWSDYYWGSIDIPADFTPGSYDVKIVAEWTVDNQTITGESFNWTMNVTAPSKTLSLTIGNNDRVTPSTTVEALTGDEITLAPEITAERGDGDVVQSDAAAITLQWYRKAPGGEYAAVGESFHGDWWFSRLSTTDSSYNYSATEEGAGTYTYQLRGTWVVEGYTTAEAVGPEYTATFAEPVESGINSVAPQNGSFTIADAATDGNVVSAAKTGDVVYIIPMADQGCALDTVKVTTGSASGDELEVEKSGGAYVFTMAGEPVWVTVTFAQAYTISTVTTEGGVLTPDASESVAGKEMWVKVAPEAGWKLKEVSASYGSGTALEITKYSSSYYYFTVPAGNVSLSATFEHPMWSIAVTGAAVEHGSITLDKSTFHEGDAVAVTATSDEGYVLDDLAFSKEDGTPITVDKWSSGIEYEVASDGKSATVSFKVSAGYNMGYSMYENCNLVVTPIFAASSEPVEQNWTLAVAKDIKHGKVALVGEDGTESESIALTAEGGEFIAKVTPDFGYEIEKVALKNASGKEPGEFNIDTYVSEDKEKPDYYTIIFDTENNGEYWLSTTYVTPSFKLKTENTTTDETTDVSAEGGIFADAKPDDVASFALSVEETTGAETTKVKEDYAVQIGTNKVDGVYEVNLTKFKNDGTTENVTENVGAMKLFFPVDAEDGTAAKVIQLHENGMGTPEVVEHKDLKVADGKVAVTLSGKLSTFIVTTAVEEPTAETFKVTFDSNGGSEVSSVTVESGKAAAKPADPTRDGYEFAGWQLDGKAYDFSTPVTADITLKATWTSTKADEKTDELAEAETVTMYRLYNPNSGEHFYTADARERADVIAAGWNDEGTGWIAPGKSDTPVYRLYNANGGEHHYTMDVGERDFLVALGWSDEGVGWYSDDARAVPLLREYNPNAFANNHNYTASRAEHDWLLGLGWNDEGVGWYAVSAG